MRLKSTTIYGVPALLEIEGVVLSNNSFMENMVVGECKSLNGFAVEENVEIGPRSDIARLLAEKIKSDNPLVQGVQDVISKYKTSKKKKSSSSETKPPVMSSDQPEESPEESPEQPSESLRFANRIYKVLNENSLDGWQDILRGTSWKLQAAPPVYEREPSEDRQPVMERIISLRTITASHDRAF